MRCLRFAGCLRRPRSRRTLTSTIAAIVAVVASVGVVVGWSAVAGANPKNEPATFARMGRLHVLEARNLEISPQLATVRLGKFVPAADKSRGVAANIGGGDELIAALTGSLVPLAVDDPSGSILAYSSWRQIAEPIQGEYAQGLKEGQQLGIPSVRIFDSNSGVDRLVATGAHSPAVSTTGRLAFVKGDQTPVLVNRPYLGHVVVGSLTKKGAVERWTTDPDRYFTYAWAGDELLVYRALPGSEATDLYAITGPGAGHLIAPQAFVIALSPDGSRVLVTVGRRMLEVVRVADGAVEASLPLDGAGVADPSSPTTPHYLMYSGSWRGNRVVANSDLGLVVLNVDEGIEVESVIATPEFAHGLVEPRFVNDATVVGWVDLASTKQVLNERSEPLWDQALASCDLNTMSCSVGDPSPPRAWQRWVQNPSR